MKTSSTCFVSISLLIAGSIALSGCGKSANPTTIAYKQVGMCKSYVTEAGTEEKAKTDEAFAVFNSKRSIILKMALVFTLIRSACT